MSAVDVVFAIQECEAWAHGQRGRKLTWEALAEAVGFSRQSLWARASIYEAYTAANTALSEGKKPRRPRSEDFQEEKISEQEKEIARFKELEQQWIERWVRIAHHARAKGFSIDDFDQPLPPMKRR